MRAIEVRGLSYTYHDGTPGLREVTFSVEKGDAVAVMGPNGAGKTTLLKHLNALLLPTSGTVIAAGIEVSRKAAAEIRKKVGFLFQNPEDQVFSPTVLEDVMFGPINMGYSRTEAESLACASLKSLGIESLADRHPAHLSYGQKKKVALAGVLVMEPEILVMDEPLAGLDYAGMKDLMGIIRKLNRENGMTVIFSTHLTERAAALSNRTIILNSGRCVAEGKTEVLLTDTELLRRAGLEPTVVTSLLLPFCPEAPPVTEEEGVKAIARLLGKARKPLQEDDGHEG